jgi:hypothetical protein
MKVQIIKSEGKVVLLETVVDGKAVRRIVPEKLVREDGDIEPSDFEKGILHGLPFAEFINPSVTGEQVETALHNAGIWTLQDLQTKGREAVGALQSVYRTDLGNILASAKVYSDKASVEKPTAHKRKTSIKETK